MRRLGVTFAAVLLATGIPYAQQTSKSKPLPDVELDRLITAGRSGILRGGFLRCTTGEVSVAEGALRFGLPGVLVQTARQARNQRMAQYHVLATGRRGWIVTKLNELVKTGVSLQRTDVRPEWQASMLYVSVNPAFPAVGSGDELHPPAEVVRVSLRGYNEVGRDNRLEIGATSLKLSDPKAREVTPGKEVGFTTAVATFDAFHVRRFAQDDVAIVVTTADGTRDCSVPTGELKKLVKD